MPFRHLTQCTDCDEVVENTFDHDCPNDPMKDPVKRAAIEDEEAAFEKHTKLWDDWQDAQGFDGMAYPSVDGRPNDIAFEGRCIIFDENDGDIEGATDYQTEILENPTWGDVLILFEQAIEATQDTHHIFLEGLMKVKRVPKFVNTCDYDVTFLQFATGS